MTPLQSDFILENFEILSRCESGDIVGSGFDATVWRSKAGTVYAASVGWVSRRLDGAKRNPTFVSNDAKHRKSTIAAQSAGGKRMSDCACAPSNLRLLK
jgi:hypothetical protein